MAGSSAGADGVDQERPGTGSPAGVVHQYQREPAAEQSRRAGAGSGNQSDAGGFFSSGRKPPAVPADSPGFATAPILGRV